MTWVTSPAAERGIQLHLHAGQRLPRAARIPSTRNTTPLQGQCDTGGGTLAQGTCLAPLVLTNVYDFATSNYLAGGGSGFKVLQRNTTQLNTQIEQRATRSSISSATRHLRVDTTYGPNGGLLSCSTDSDCQSAQGPGASFICACVGGVTATGTDTAQTCVSSGACAPGTGQCIRQDCRDDVATFHEKACANAPDANKAQCDTDSSTRAPSRVRSASSSRVSTRPWALAPTTASRSSDDEIRSLLHPRPRRSRRHRASLSGELLHDRAGKRLVVEIKNGATGTLDQPIPISVFQPTPFTIDISAQLPDGSIDTSFNGGDIISSRARSPTSTCATCSSRTVLPAAWSSR